MHAAGHAQRIEIASAIFEREGRHPRHPHREQGRALLDKVHRPGKIEECVLRQAPQVPISGHRDTVASQPWGQDRLDTLAKTEACQLASTSPVHPSASGRQAQRPAMAPAASAPTMNARLPTGRPVRKRLASRQGNDDRQSPLEGREPARLGVSQ